VSVLSREGICNRSAGSFVDEYATVAGVVPSLSGIFEPAMIVYEKEQ